MHLLSSKEVSSELFESARQLSGLTCSGFVTAEAYAAQIALMVVDVVPDFGWPSKPGASGWGGRWSGRARHAVDDSGTERDGGDTRKRSCGPKAPAQHLQLHCTTQRAAGKWFCTHSGLNRRRNISVWSFLDYVEDICLVVFFGPPQTFPNPLSLPALQFVSVLIRYGIHLTPAYINVYDSLV